MRLDKLDLPEHGIGLREGALTPRVSLVTRAGEDNAVDVFHNFSFD